MTPALPPAELTRLKKREAAQRSQTRAMAKASKTRLKVETVSIEGLWLLQRGVCGCDERCGPLNPNAEHGDPDHIVFGHLTARRFGGGHTIRNSALQRADCNQAATKHENNRGRVETKFTPDKTRRKSGKGAQRKNAWGNEKYKRTMTGKVVER